jgi:hypothetical protein
MKTFSRTVKFVILPALAIGSILALRVFAADSPKKDIQAPYVLTLVPPRELKDPTGDVNKFKTVLDRNSHIYCLKHHEKDKPGKPGKDTPMKKNCPETVSSTSAGKTGTDEYTLICAPAHVTQMAGFDTAGQMAAVEALFK